MIFARVLGPRLGLGKILVDRRDRSGWIGAEAFFGAIWSDWSGGKKGLSTDPSDPSGAEISQNREEADGESVFRLTPPLIQSNLPTTHPNIP